MSGTWGWAGIQPAEVVGENEFGNLVVKDTDGKYWRICPEEVYCEVIAADRAELNALASHRDFLEDWHMLSLVEAAQAAIGLLQEGYKYCLVTPAILGGKYEPSNMRTAPLAEVVGLSGEIGRQIRHYADGTKVRIRVSDTINELQ